MSSDLVTLRDGQVVPLTTLQRLWALEDRGVIFRLLDADRVRATPAELLDEDDRAFLAANKVLLIDILVTEVRV